jgi:hypothetical protein
MGEYKVESYCHNCKQYLPIEEFEVLKTMTSSAQWAMFKFAPYEIKIRSYTCKKCGTTRREDWIEKWKGE